MGGLGTYQAGLGTALSKGCQELDANVEVCRGETGRALTGTATIRCQQSACRLGLVGHGEPRSDAEQNNGHLDLWEYLLWL